MVKDLRQCDTEIVMWWHSGCKISQRYEEGYHRRRRCQDGEPTGLSFECESCGERFETWIDCASIKSIASLTTSIDWREPRITSMCADHVSS